MTWLWVDNPAYAGQTPRKLTRACHDGSHFIARLLGTGLTAGILFAKIARREVGRD